VELLEVKPGARVETVGETFYKPAALAVVKPAASEH